MIGNCGAHPSRPIIRSPDLRSEGGFELVHQSVVVMPHWHVQADAEGRWQMTMQLSLDTSAAEARSREHEAVAAV